MTGQPAVGDEARPAEEARLPFRRRWAWTLQMNRPMASPFIGLVCALSIGGPLAVGIATGYPRAGGWAAVGSFFTDMAVFQPGHRFRARIVAGTGVLVAIGAFLGALTGIRGIAIYPLVVVCTFAAGLLVELGPQAALIGVSSVTSLVFSASFDVSATEALVVGGVTLLGGLFTAVLAVVARRGLARYADPTRHPGATGWAWAHEVPVTMRRSRTRAFGPLLACRAPDGGGAGRDGALPGDEPGRRVLDPRGGAVHHATRGPAPRRRAVLRVIGSVAGAALTTLVLVVLRPDTTLLAVLAVIASAIAFSVQRVNFGLYITFVTCIFVLLTAFGGLPARTAISNRVVDNLIGSALAVAALWLWPSRPRRAAAGDP